MTDLEKQLLDAHNQIRSQNRIGPLRWSYTLGAAAQGHSTVMAQHNQLAHEGIGDGTPETRVQDAGYKGFGGWENAAMGYPDIGSLMTGWLHSPGHRANILNRQVDEMGGGTGVGQSGKFWTTNFGQSNGRPPEPDPEPVRPGPTPHPPPSPPAPTDAEFMLIGQITPQKYSIEHGPNTSSYSYRPGEPSGRTP